MALRTLRELPEFEMAPGSPDVLGWSVHDSGDQVCGNVVDLFVDTDRDEVRYVGVRLGDGRQVLVVPGSLDLDRDMGVAKVVNLSREQLQAMPTYSDPQLSPEIVERYYILYFSDSEPVGAWEPSPPASAAALHRAEERFKGLGRVVRTKEGAVDNQERKPDIKDRLMGKSEKGVKPGDGVAIFAANEPWDIADVPERLQSEETGQEFKGTMTELGPEAEREELWQAEQPGITSGLDAMRPKVDHPRHNPQEK